MQVQATLDRDLQQLASNRTLGANIVIHPATIARIGREQTGLGFLSPQATWGAFPGHSQH